MPFLEAPHMHEDTSSIESPTLWNALQCALVQLPFNAASLPAFDGRSRLPSPPDTSCMITTIITISHTISFITSIITPSSTFVCVHIYIYRSLCPPASSFAFHECRRRHSRLRLLRMPFLYFAHLYDEVGHGPVDHTLLHLRQLPKWVNPLHTITAQRHACGEEWRLRWL